MRTPAPIAALTVVYARDIARVAEFYRRTLALDLLDRDADFVLVGNGAYEVAVVRMAGADSAEARPAEPVHARTGTPIKASFLVDSLERAAAAAAASGGSLKPLASAWRWRDQLHLDGQDPEGNVVQLRVAAA